MNIYVTLIATGLGVFFGTYYPLLVKWIKDPYMTFFADKRKNIRYIIITILNCLISCVIVALIIFPNIVTTKSTPPWILGFSLGYLENSIIKRFLPLFSKD